MWSGGVVCSILLLHVEGDRHRGQFESVSRQRNIAFPRQAGVSFVNSHLQTGDLFCEPPSRTRADSMSASFPEELVSPFCETNTDKIASP